jgi:hypothetical protein
MGFELHRVAKPPAWLVTERLDELVDEPKAWSPGEHGC